ncbi:hypothetical protein [Corynebacterium pelargi]|uniref:Uncharacterized protein n=1 Tax=Corynebacterium pelargi TaxID=1471400 RepID=A0A410WAS1_9CORY|nr:hypothetical protein [Corynebacterium pelargi]QAU53034.1 hypothetical protein CPELA_08895 [Corynebacterium pelargi]GGG75313.1 hypothetical protein GCM10007338_11060 [Corynebacterium pelargi]
MNRRHPKQEGVTRRQLEMLREDDAFLSALAQGVDPSDGRDELAALFLQAREEVSADMPKAPTLAELGFHGSDKALTNEMPAVDAPAPRRRGRFAAEEATEGDAEVIQLHRPTRALFHGLVGAAAATALIAGSGVAIHNAEPGSALYGLNQQIFGSKDVEVVQLASALQEANDLKASGDIEGAMRKLAEAQALVDRMEPKGRKVGQSLVDRVSTTITATVTTTAPAPDQDTTTVTKTKNDNKTTTSETTRTEEPTVEANPDPVDLPSETPTEEETGVRNAPPVEENAEAQPGVKDPVDSISRSLSEVVQEVAPGIDR